MLRCLVIGGGMQFRQCVSFLKLRESVGEIKIVGIIDDTAYADTLFDWPFMSYLNVSNLAINCCLIATDNGHIHIVEKLHIPDDVIVPWRALFIPGFTFGKYLSLKKSHVSIIASNCWGGVTYSYLGLRFLSPFINMWIENDIEIYANLKDVINNHLEFVKEEYNPVDKISYPVYTLGGGQMSTYEPLS